jgi:phosphoglycolate phosphatase
MIEAHDLSPSKAVMIGDRRYDVLGARANAMPAIGALWGYGSERELTDAGAHRIAAAPVDIPAMIDGLLG